MNDRYDGTDYVCDNCGCEIMVKHKGDEAKMGRDSTYTCMCGEPMRLEHAAAAPAQLSR
ncbi:MAG: hypothetical protein LC744_05320 [Chloroflexi bacterium]|jgi:hypothetical protein|nr:hypothetical protein [Chloroflexota bacterium]